MNRFAAIHQFHPGTAHGDAITQQMLRLQVAPPADGSAVLEIFAVHVEPGLEDRIKPDPGLHRVPTRTFCLLHHSLGSRHLRRGRGSARPDRDGLPQSDPRALLLRRDVPPAHPARARTARPACPPSAASGSRTRTTTAARCSRSDSGGSRCCRSGSTTPNSPAFAPIPALRSTDWLYVGRIVGNKCQHELGPGVRPLRADIRRRGSSRSRSVTPSSATTSRSFESEAARLGVADRVVMLGKVSDNRARIRVRRSRSVRLDERARGIRGSHPRGHGRRPARGRLRCRCRPRGHGRCRHPASRQGSRGRRGHGAGDSSRSRSSQTGWSSGSSCGSSRFKRFDVPRLLERVVDKAVGRRTSAARSRSRARSRPATAWR